MSSPFLLVHETSISGHRVNSAVPGSVCLARVQKANALDVYKAHLRQIQRDWRSGAPEFGFNLINVGNAKLPA
jgi:hypothetical protein